MIDERSHATRTVPPVRLCHAVCAISRVELRDGQDRCFDPRGPQQPRVPRLTVRRDDISPNITTLRPVAPLDSQATRRRHDRSPVPLP